MHFWAATRFEPTTSAKTTNVVLRAGRIKISRQRTAARIRRKANKIDVHLMCVLREKCVASIHRRRKQCTNGPNKIKSRGESKPRDSRIKPRELYERLRDQCKMNIFELKPQFGRTASSEKFVNFGFIQQLRMLGFDRLLQRAQRDNFFRGWVLENYLIERSFTIELVCTYQFDRNVLVGIDVLACTAIPAREKQFALQSKSYWNDVKRFVTGNALNRHIFAPRARKKSKASAERQKCAPW